MGSGSWDSYTRIQHTSAKAARGQSTFHYSDQIRAGKTAAKANDLLDPTKVAGPTSPFAGQVMREVAISDEHPSPTPIAIMLDVTASNGAASRAVHAKLPELFGLLQRKGYVQDPQILIGAIGDAHTDKVPLQVGQFESDNRIDEMVEAMYLEGGGGGQVMETYELGAYFLAKHTYLEPYHKQGRRGYAIFIGDEKPYEVVRRDYNGRGGYAGHTLKSLIGDEIEADILTEKVFELLSEQYETFFLFQQQGSYRADEILPPWRELLGENAVVLENPENVCEFIAGLLAMREAGLDLDQVSKDLVEQGFDASAVQSVSKTLAVVGGRGSGGGGTIARQEGGSLDLRDDSDGGADRL